MRLTQNLLQEYVEAELAIKRLEKTKSLIREAILGRKEPEFRLGPFIVEKKEITQTRALPSEEITATIGEELAAKILRETKSTRVTVKRIA